MAWRNAGAVVLALFAISLNSLFVYGLRESRQVNITWDSTQANLSRTMLELYLGDTIRFECSDTSYFIIEQQTLSQVETCNKSEDLDTTTSREMVGQCISDNSPFFVVTFNSASDFLPGVNAYEAGMTYYFTSYSPPNATNYGNIYPPPTSGGWCAIGAVLEVRINESPSPTVDNGDPETMSVSGPVDESSGTNVNVDGPNDTFTIGGPGQPTNSLFVGGVNGASGFHSRELSFITALSAALCTLITKLVH